MSEARPRATTHRHESPRHRILLVDDNPDHRLLESRSLKTLEGGVDVVEATSALEGLELLQGDSYDLVVADYQMPGMDGLTFLRSFRERDHEVPMVIVTGVGSEAVAVKALKLGAQDYVIKDTGYLDLLPSIAERAMAAFRSQKHLDEARRQLAASERRYRDLVHELDAIVWEADARTLRFSFVSRRAESILGYPAARWLESPELWQQILHPEDRQAALDARQRAIAAGSDYEFTYRVLAKDGRAVWLRDKVRFSPQPGGATLLCGLMIDMTRQKLAEEEAERLQQQLVQAQKLESIGTLVGGIAHGFNNLLQSILGYASLARKSLDTNPQLQGYLEAIIQSGEGAAELTGQLLAFGRPQEPKVELINLNQLVDGSLRLMRHMIPTTIEIETTRSAKLWSVEADSPGLEQVVMNLCVNARDAMPAGGRLTLSTENVMISDEQAKLRLEAKAGSYVMLQVTDTGHGMTRGIMKRIFDPFFTSKKVGEGTGLGLAVAYGVVRSHHGWIEVESRPGEGAVFKVYLPAFAKQAPNIDATTEGIEGGRETILVVDDEPLVLTLATEILRLYGYRTLTAADGSEALEVYTQNQDAIDLVVLDLSMPKLNGLECGRQLRHLNPTLPLLVSSGHGTELKLEGEALPIVAKPYRPERLAQAVRTMLDRRAAAG